MTFWILIWNITQVTFGVTSSLHTWWLNDGKLINVRANPWLRAGDSSYIQTLLISRLRNLKANDLIDPLNGKWNSVFIHEIFHDTDAQRIISMPLCLQNAKDKVIRKLSKDDNFIMKSTYYHIMENMVDNVDFHENGDWNSIWQLDVPQKMKLLLWRVARGCLPTRMRLSSGGLVCPIIVPFVKTLLKWIDTHPLHL